MAAKNGGECSTDEATLMVVDGTNSSGDEESEPVPSGTQRTIQRPDALLSNSANGFQGEQSANSNGSGVETITTYTEEEWHLNPVPGDNFPDVEPASPISSRRTSRRCRKIRRRSVCPSRPFNHNFGETVSWRGASPIFSSDDITDDQSPMMNDNIYSYFSPSDASVHEDFFNDFDDLFDDEDDE